MILNRYNFIRWSDDVAPYDAGNGDGLPRAYYADRERCGAMPVLVDGDTLAFYTNTDSGVGIDPADFADLRLRLVNARTGAVVSASVGVLNQDLINPAAMNLYSAFTVPPVADDIYRLEIYNLTGGAVRLASNELVGRTDADVANNTLVCRFRNGRQFFKTRYQEIDSTFHQTFRLSISVIERQYETDKEVYTEVTGGKPRTFENYLRRYAKFETYYFDMMAHEAAAVMIEHDYVTFNGQRFRHKSPYKEGSDPRAKITKGEFEMYDEDFGQVNRCSVGATVLLGDGAGAYIAVDAEETGILVR